MAIKGKKRTKSKRPKGAAPKPVVVTPKVPFLSRRWVQITAIAVVTLIVGLGLGYGFGKQHKVNVAVKEKALETRTLTQFKTNVDQALSGVGSPSADGFTALPNLPTAQQFRDGKVDAATVRKQATAAGTSIKKAMDALSALQFSELESGSTDQALIDNVTGARYEMVAALDTYHQSADLLKHAVEVSGSEQQFLLDAAQRELETASQTFSHAYSRYFSLMISNGLVHPPPDLSQVPGGAGVPPPTG